MRRFSSVRITVCLLVMTVWSGSAATNYVWQDSPSPGPPYTNWATAAHTIQDAVDAAEAGDEVLVTNGVYATGGRVIHGTMTNRVAVDKPLTVRSVNGLEVTVIAGAKAPSGGNGDGAIRCVYLNSGASLSGFTLTNGATRGGFVYPNRESSGGGVYCESASAFLTDCRLAGNSAQQGGGASRGRLNTCKLIGNTAEWAGGAYCSTLNDCTLIGNAAAYCGAVYYSTLSNCVLTGNTAIYGGGEGWSWLNHCTLTGNSAEEWGGAGHYGWLKNCIVAGNTATAGGGTSMSVLTNCVLVDNAASSAGGGAFGSFLNNCTLTGNSAAFVGGGACAAELTNSIAYFNWAPEYPNWYTNSILNYCCTTPLPTNGVGNITNAPLFVDTNGWNNLRLQPNSPCIDAGNNDFVTTLTDLDGNPRIINGIVDMGAYEFVPLTPADLVEHLIALVTESDLPHKRPLLASMEAALASIHRGNHNSATGQLGAFQNKVRAQVYPSNANLALALIQGAGQAIDALGGDGSAKVAGKIHSLKRHPNGKMQMKMSGPAGKVCIVEASTNLVDWEAVGEATVNEDGSFEFEDDEADKHQSRFYRAVTSKNNP